MKIKVISKNYYTNEVVDEQMFNNKHDAIRSCWDYEKNPKIKCEIEEMYDDNTWSNDK